MFFDDLINSRLLFAFQIMSEVQEVHSQRKKNMYNAVKVLANWLSCPHVAFSCHLWSCTRLPLAAVVAQR